MYCEANDLYLAYGKQNVRKWADLQNDEDAAQITARIEYACEQATAQMDDRLRDGPYAFPVELGSGESYPVQLVRHTALLAGTILYESRGISDAAMEQEHSLRWAEKRVEAWIRSVMTRVVKLDLPLVAGVHPFVTTDDDEECESLVDCLPETFVE